jgi:hypothetical protein
VKIQGVCSLFLSALNNWFWSFTSFIFCVLQVQFPYLEKNIETCQPHIEIRSSHCWKYVGPFWTPDMNLKFQIVRVFRLYRFLSLAVLCTNKLYFLHLDLCVFFFRSLSIFKNDIWQVYNTKSSLERGWNEYIIFKT